MNWRLVDDEDGMKWEISFLISPQDQLSYTILAVFFVENSSELLDFATTMG